MESTDYKEALGQLVHLLNTKEGYEEEVTDYKGRIKECNAQIKGIDEAIYEIKRKYNIGEDN